MKRFLLSVGRVFSRGEDILLAVLLGVMCVLAIAQILQRNIWGSGFVWTDELLRILVLWLTMVGSIIASRVDNHIRMDFLLQLFGAVWRQRLRRAIYACTAVVCAVVAWAAAKFVLMEADFGSLLLGGYPAWWFQIILPVGFILIAWRYMLLALWPRDPADQTGVVKCGK